VCQQARASLKGAKSADAARELLRVDRLARCRVADLTCVLRAVAPTSGQGDVPLGAERTAGYCVTTPSNPDAVAAHEHGVVIAASDRGVASAHSIAPQTFGIDPIIGGSLPVSLQPTASHRDFLSEPAVGAAPYEALRAATVTAEERWRNAVESAVLNESTSSAVVLDVRRRKPARKVERQAVGPAAVGSLHDPRRAVGDLLRATGTAMIACTWGRVVCAGAEAAPKGALPPTRTDAAEFGITHARVEAEPEVDPVGARAAVASAADWMQLVAAQALRDHFATGLGR
jgi:hypothetical protein